MQTLQERLSALDEWYETCRKDISAEVVTLPIIEYFDNKWATRSADPEDSSKRYSYHDWTSIKFYLAEEDTTKCINLFIEMMDSDPRIRSIGSPDENEKHVAYRVETNIRSGRYSWSYTGFSCYFYFDRSKFCHAEISKIEIEHEQYERKTFKVMCA